MKREEIARVAHEINRAYCQSLGDDTQDGWDDSPEWQKESALAGVDMHLANPDATPEQSHESWLEQKIADGWAYGEVKDVIEKRHPCCVPYDQLPPEQKAKDYLFRAVVHTLKDIPDAEEAVAAYIKANPAAPVAGFVVPDSCKAVQYLGKRSPWNDRVYHTGLTFVTGQVRNVPKDIAEKLLRHVDLFKEAEAPAPVQAQDDTAFQIADGEKRQAAKVQTDIDQDVIDQVNSMEDKDGLIELAATRYQLKLDKRQSVDTMRQRITEHINRFGS